MGPIALGMTRKIKVILRANPEILGKFTDEFDIVTKHEIYHIPISAYILGKN
jgi:predicted metal-dependent peptidase